MPVQKHIPIISSAIVALSSVFACLQASTVPAPSPTPEPAEIHVRTVGELKRAFGQALPDQTVLIHAGTYEDLFYVTRGGTPEQPVTFKPAGDGPVRITAPAGRLKPTSREPASGANLSRTLTILDASDIIIENLSIHGGIMIGREGTHQRTHAWKQAEADVADWIEKGGNAHGIKHKWIRTMGWVRGRLGPGKPGWMDAQFPGMANRITVRDCDITGRGIALWQAQSCKLVRNKIHDIEPFINGIVLQFMCMYNDIVENDISGMHDPLSHWHGEGIRLVNAACYNLVARNYVHDITGNGFGIATDLFCDNNTIIENRVARIQNIAFTAQAWDSDNRWVNNVAEDANIGFEFSSWWWEHESANQPTRNCEVRGNRAYRCSNADMAAARINGYRFADNNFKRVHLSPNLASSFAGQGGLWDGSPQLPDWISTAPPKRSLKFDF